MAEPTPNGDVFINRPFDAGFLDVFRAIVFAVRACGFRPRCGWDESDGATVRIDKISDMIGQCDRGIHDLSAVELDATTSMPRFNMPLELGISIGAKRFGGPRQRSKRLLILDKDKHRYDHSTSDISGQDIAHHGGAPDKAIQAVRNWLATNRKSGSPGLPGGRALAGDYLKVREYIDIVIARERLDPWGDMTHGDYLNCLDAALRMIGDEQST